METYTNLLATYEEQQDQIEAGEEVTEELVTLEQVEAAKQAIIDSVQPTIDEINQKLADGVSFDELIQEYGTDPGMQDSATRAEGYSVHMDSTNWDAAFTAGAFTMEKIGGHQRTGYGSASVLAVSYPPRMSSTCRSAAVGGGRYTSYVTKVTVRPAGRTGRVVVPVP